MDQNQLHPGMVGIRRCGYSYHPSEALWENHEHEHVQLFFSNKYAGRSDLFEGLEIWKEERFRALQGTYPVIFLSFAGIKHTDYKNTRTAMNGILADLYNSYYKILQDNIFTNADRQAYQEVRVAMGRCNFSQVIKQIVRMALSLLW